MIINSLGWGVQSFTLAAMSALGKLPKIDYAIHADTSFEKESTYRFAKKWTPFLESNGVRVVTVNDKSCKIRDMVKNIHLPAHTTHLNGQSAGILHRQCTGRWKIDPMRRWLRDNGFKNGGVEMWLGISLDEALRMKDSSVKWIKHGYPLVDLRMSRADCVAWLLSNGLEVPEKSSCVMCPYHSSAEWLRMKENGGQDWQIAQSIDEAIRMRRPNFISYVHNSRVPLAELKSACDFGAYQANFLDMECDSGYCFN